MNNLIIFLLLLLLLDKSLINVFSAESSALVALVGLDTTRQSFDIAEW
jgi:hypothetical protein